MENETHHGGCGCGAVRYETIGEPSRVTVCHCRYCQTRTGSAFGVSVFFDENNFRITQGTLKAYPFPTESGRSLTWHFCDTCGTSVYGDAEFMADMKVVFGGTFDPPTFWYTPEREVFCRSKAGFVSTNIEDKYQTSQIYDPVQTECNAALALE